MNEIKKLQAINNQLSAVEKPPAVMLASKNQPAEIIEAYLQNEHRLFGENRVQEAKDKWPALLNRYQNCQLHLIGPLQTNKVKDALALFNVIQSLDRAKLVDKIASLQSGSPRRKYFIQINIGNESQKSGVAPEEVQGFHKYCTQRDLDVLGLMCIPPANENPEPYFQLAKQLCDQLNLPELSMGMSADYLQAAAHGATMVRIGSAIFGERS